MEIKKVIINFFKILGMDNNCKKCLYRKNFDACKGDRKHGYRCMDFKPMY